MVGGLVLTNDTDTDTVTVPGSAANFELPAGGTASSPSVSCSAAVAKVSWAAGWGGKPSVANGGDDGA
jgi:hypothetical protein